MLSFLCEGSFQLRVCGQILEGKKIVRIREYMYIEKTSISNAIFLRTYSSSIKFHEETPRVSLIFHYAMRIQSQVALYWLLILVQQE